jgi:hypothetical protein
MHTEIALRTATRKALRLAGKAFVDSDVALEVSRKKAWFILAYTLSRYNTRRVLRHQQPEQKLSKQQGQQPRRKRRL